MAVKNYILCTIFCLLLTGLQYGDTAAQSLGEIFIDNSGLQFGTFRGQTDYNDQGFDYSFRLFNQHSISENRFGEISLTIGSISGNGYRSRLIPLEYRVGQRIADFIRFSDFRKSSVYLYGGVGFIYHKPVEILAPDDPLTIEMGPSLPSSSLWDFTTGIAPFIPAGVGIDMPLDQHARLSFNAGYNQSINALRLKGDRVPNGYWSFSAGLNFSRPKKRVLTTPAPPPPPLQHYKPEQTIVHAIPEAPVKTANLLKPLLAEFNRENLRFDILSSEISKKGEEWIAGVSKLINLSQGVRLDILGHADATGTNPVNEMISENRARAVWLAFVDRGIEPARLNYSWHADRKPEDTNATMYGRQNNRRVEFNIQNESAGEIRVAAGSVSDDYQTGHPAFQPSELSFTWLELNDKSRSYEKLHRLSAFLIENPHLKLFVASVSDLDYPKPIFKELDKGRSEKLRAILIKQGVKAGQVEAYDPYKSVLPQEIQQFLMRNLPQQTLLIPVINSDESRLDLRGADRNL